jgi:predicted dehydrogenase
MVADFATGDTSCALVRYRSGATAYVAAMLATPFISRVALYGSEGWIEIRDKAHVEAPEGWTVLRCKKGGTPEARDVPPEQPVRANLEAFARAIEGKAPYPITTDEMIANAAVMEAVFRSAASGRLEAVPT